MIEEKDIIPIGKFFRTHALKGELNAVTDDYDPDMLAEGYPLIVEVDGIYVPFYAESVRPKGSQGCLVKLEGIDSQERAQEFVNRQIFMLRRDIAEWLEVEEDEVAVDDDLIGFNVMVNGIGRIGTVDSVDSSTANLLLLVKSEDTDEIIYIPFVEEFVEEIDPKDKCILLSLPDGIIEMNKK
ncbi:MAG: ribosome maturation factor RimM [Muribaculaceae bacterium]|nr:ribosome maturation factor RimM [Muribaculaceae bacterium]